MTANAVNKLLPPETYTLEIVESEYVPTCNGLGMVLKTKAQVIGGEFDGRPFYINYNLENANEQVQEIGQREFAGLRRATGVLSPQFTEDLHWIPFGVKITAQTSKRTGELVNWIVQYLFEREDDAPAPKPRTKVKCTEWRKAA